MNDHSHQEIIIIKRGSEEEEGHHGGAWKIAFADFMTAMMALFLVLWLINAANEETKRAVASYFNPIKLVDRNRSSKGVEETNSGPTYDGQSGGPSDPVESKPEEKNPAKPEKSQTQAIEPAMEQQADAAFFENPMAALDKIEASVLEKNGISNKIETKGDGAMPGKFTDPFNSGFWEEKPEQKSNESNSSPLPPKEVETPKSESDLLEASPLDSAENNTRKSEAEELEKDVREEIAKKLGDGQLAEDAVNVTPTEKGILIQLTDMPSSSMFDIGSAIPRGETIVAINAIAKALTNKPGKILIHGHTDARQFEMEGNGNWRLSVNRAQSIYFILMRAGMADSRISEISGFADRRPLAENDPLADQNRRIEIFLENS